MTEIKQEALAHYDRMIEWAKKQNQSIECRPGIMLEAISEQWYGPFCSYCQKYFGICSECELTRENVILFDCCNGLWRKMTKSLTWGEWVINAEAVRKYINERG